MLQIKLHSANPGRFRLGSAGLEATDDLAHSDTLFGGWIHAFVNLYGAAALPPVLEAFEVGMCRCSSAFHFVDIYQNGQPERTLLFFPRPFLRRVQTAASTTENVSMKKKLKRLRYVSFDLLRQMLQSATPDAEGEWRFTTDLLAHTVFDDEYAVAPTELPEPLRQQLQTVRFKTIEDVPKVTIMRDSAKSEGPFYETDCLLTWLKFDDWELRPGFYFLVQLPGDDGMAKRLRAALNLLADEGLGGERSCGAGAIAAVETNQFDWNGSGSLAMLLSLTLPAKNMNLNQIITGQTIVRGGYVGASGIRKNRCRMLQEGSIVRLPFFGSLVPDAATDSLRYGQAFYFQFGDKL